MRYAGGRRDHVVNVKRVATDGDHFTACGDPECSVAFRNRQEQNALHEAIVLRLRHDRRLLDTGDDFPRSVGDFAEHDDLRTAPHHSVRQAKLKRIERDSGGSDETVRRYEQMRERRRGVVQRIAKHRGVQHRASVLDRLFWRESHRGTSGSRPRFSLYRGGLGV